MIEKTPTILMRYIENASLILDGISKRFALNHNSFERPKNIPSARMPDGMHGQIKFKSDGEIYFQHQSEQQHAELYH